MAGTARSCCVPKCEKTRADNVVLHSFPNPEQENERFVTWVKAVGSTISVLDHMYIHKNRRICHNHFEAKYLTWSKRLCSGAVPTLYMPGLQKEIEVLRDISNIEDTPTHSRPMEDSTFADITASKPGSDFRLMDSVKLSSNIEKKESSFIDNNKASVQMVQKLNKQNIKYGIRLKRSSKLSENKKYQKIVGKFTSLASIFMLMKFREAKKKKDGEKIHKRGENYGLEYLQTGAKILQATKQNICFAISIYP